MLVGGNSTPIRFRLANASSLSFTTSTFESRPTVTFLPSDSPPPTHVYSCMKDTRAPCMKMPPGLTSGMCRISPARAQTPGFRIFKTVEFPDSSLRQALLQHLQETCRQPSHNRLVIHLLPRLSRRVPLHAAHPPPRQPTAAQNQPRPRLDIYYVSGGQRRGRSNRHPGAKQRRSSLPSTVRREIKKRI